MMNKTKLDAFRVQAAEDNQADEPTFPRFVKVREKIVTVYKSFEILQCFQSAFFGKIT
jgi:hypothetical protein